MKWTDEVDGEFNGNPCKIRVGVSETYSESAILKLAKMVLNINENNTVDFDINGGIDNAVCIEYNDLVKLKDLAKEIVGDDYVC